MNAIQILGTITREIETKYTASGTAIASFGIAHNEKRKDASGNYQDVAHFFDVTAFGKTAENIQKYFSKGSRILIQGSLDFQSWTTQTGEKRSKVSIKLNQFDFIDRKSDTQTTQPQNTIHTPPGQVPTQEASTQMPEIDITDDVIPF